MRQTRRKNRRKKSNKLFTLFLTLSIVLLISFLLKDKLDFYSNEVIAGQISEEENKDLIDSNDEEENLNTNSNSTIKPEGILIVANKNRPLDSEYKPEDLIVPDIKFSFDEDHEKRYMREEAAKALEELFKNAYEEGQYIFAVSGFRSYNTQKYVFNDLANRLGEEEANKVSARPGESEHQTGLAMDITSQNVGFRLVEEFGNTDEGKWVESNAHKFGFIIRYPKDKTHITGYKYEPWHLRYVGRDMAEEIYNEQITLEEYFEIE